MKKILFVDLDMSLIKTDIMREQLLQFFAHSPWETIKILFRHKFNPAPVKAEVVKKITTDPETLPYNQDVLNLIKKAKAEGRTVVLATATHIHMAQKIANHLGLFDDVMATTDDYNCKAARKLVKMKEYAGDTPFDYVGDSRADLTIFPDTDMPIIVGNLSYSGKHERIQTPGFLKPFVKAIRPHQWAKNLLIFLPLLVSHNLAGGAMITATLGFVCFSLAASAIYLINDMVDIEDDRHHLTKKNRPFARGDLSLDQGIVMSLSLLCISFALSAIFLPQGLIVLALYISLTFLYSFSFKSIAILDVFCLSTLYAIRVVYGHVINDVTSSAWLLAFCVFFFLSLAFMKRSTELHKTEQNEQRLSARRGYETADGFLIRVAGIASGLLSILVLAFYTNSYDVTRIYKYPDFLWGAAYVLLYWKLRLWLIAMRGNMHQDPVVFAIKDRGSYVTGFLVVVFAALAKGIFL